MPCLAVGLSLLAPRAGAQLLATSARQQSGGSLRFLAHYQGVSGQTLNFSVNDSGSCSSQNGVSFPCGQAGDYEAEGSGSGGIVRLIWQPGERFQYYATYGVGDYSLKVPSATVTNVLTGDRLGQTFGAGLKASIVPDTVVTPAIALDVSAARSQYDFNRRFPGGTPGANNNISQRLTLMTYQVAVESSHLFTISDSWKLEPYGGLKWVRVQADLKDLTDGSHAGGKQDTATPFLGLRVPAGEKEAFFAEASFVGGLQYGAGLEIRFK